MAALQWSEALALDTPAMDRIHEEFILLLARVEDVPDEGLLACWCTLVDHTAEHFGREDAWMLSTGFASANCHTVQHRVVLQVMREGLVAGQRGELAALRGMAHELGVWFVHHAQTMDAALALHLRSVGLDLETGQLARPEALPATALHHCGSASCRTEAAEAAGA